MGKYGEVPEEIVEEMRATHGDNYQPHEWFAAPNAEIRHCSRCGAREAYWDDYDYPYDPCNLIDNVCGELWNQIPPHVSWFGTADEYHTSMCGGSPVISDDSED